MLDWRGSPLLFFEIYLFLFLFSMKAWDFFLRFTALFRQETKEKTNLLLLLKSFSWVYWVYEVGTCIYKYMEKKNLMKIINFCLKLLSVFWYWMQKKCYVEMIPTVGWYCLEKDQLRFRQEEQIISWRKKNSSDNCRHQNNHISSIIYLSYKFWNNAR